VGGFSTQVPWTLFQSYPDRLVALRLASIIQQPTNVCNLSKRTFEGGEGRTGAGLLLSRNVLLLTRPSIVAPRPTRTAVASLTFSWLCLWFSRAKLETLKRLETFGRTKT